MKAFRDPKSRYAIVTKPGRWRAPASRCLDGKHPALAAQGSDGWRRATPDLRDQNLRDQIRSPGAHLKIGGGTQDYPAAHSTASPASPRAVAGWQAHRHRSGSSVIQATAPRETDATLCVLSSESRISVCIVTEIIINMVNKLTIDNDVN